MENVKAPHADIKRIYVCGKMSGIKDYNRPKFNTIAKQLRNQGFQVENPAEVQGQPHWEWSDYMRASLKKMMDCDALYVLTGYQTSAGATIEIQLAKDLGMPVFFEPDR